MARGGYRVTLGEDPKFYPASDDKQAFARVRVVEDSWSLDQTTGEFVRGESTWYQAHFYGKDAEALQSFAQGDRLIVLGRVEEENVERDGRTFHNKYLRADTFGPDMAYMDVAVTRGGERQQRREQTMRQEQDQEPSHEAATRSPQPAQAHTGGTPHAFEAGEQRPWQGYVQNVMAAAVNDAPQDMEWADAEVDAYYANQSNEQLGARVQQYRY